MLHVDAQNCLLLLLSNQQCNTTHLCSMQIFFLCNSCFANLFFHNWGSSDSHKLNTNDSCFGLQIHKVSQPKEFFMVQMAHLTTTLKSKSYSSNFLFKLNQMFALKNKQIFVWHFCICHLSLIVQSLTSFHFRFKVCKLEFPYLSSF